MHLYVLKYSLSSNLVEWHVTYVVRLCALRMTALYKVLALYFTIYNLTKLCANAVYIFLVYICDPWRWLQIFAETCRSGSLFMEKCNLLVINYVFMNVSCMYNVQYSIEHYVTDMIDCPGVIYTTYKIVLDITSE